MTTSLCDLTDDSNSVQFSNGHFERLLTRGVLMPAGVFVPPDAKHYYFADRPGVGRTLCSIKASRDEARACGLAMRAYADAVKHGDAAQREWVDRFDRDLCAMADGVVEFFATCGGFDIS